MIGKKWEPGQAHLITSEHESKQQDNATHPREQVPPILDETELKAVEGESEIRFLRRSHHKSVCLSEFYTKYTLPLFSWQNNILLTLY